MTSYSAHYRDACEPTFCGSKRIQNSTDLHSSAMLGDTSAPTAADPVNHPEYYGGGDNPYEAIKVIQAWELDFELGSALKYIARAGKKTPSATTDLGKAIRYLQFELEKLERGR